MGIKLACPLGHLFQHVSTNQRTISSDFTIFFFVVVEGCQGILIVKFFIEKIKLPMMD